MKKLFCILLTAGLILSFFALPVFAAPEKTSVAIVIPADCDVTVPYAAQTLADYLEPLCSGVQVVTEGSAVPGGAAVITVGPTSGAQSEADAMTDGSYVIKSRDGFTEINGGGTHGNLNAVFRFLRDFAGYHCYTAVQGMKTAQTELTLPEDIDIEYTSYFLYTDTDWLSPRDPLYSVANGLNGNTYRYLSPEQGGNVGYISGLCHTFTGEFCSADKYFGEHPEYFALRDGKRTSAQLCLSNEDVYTVVRDEVMALLREHHDPNAAMQMVSLTQADNQNYCTCENCKALDDANGSPAGSMITFVNRIARDVKAAGYDNVMLDTFAYTYTRKAPSAVVPEDNVIVRLCTIECCFTHTLDDPDCPENADLMADLAAWGKIAKHMSIWDYTTNYAHTFGVFPDLDVIQRNMQIFYENSAIGVYEEGAYYMDQCNTEFGELRGYLLSRLMVDPYCDLDAEMRGFCEAFYGEGGEYIIRFIKEICKNAAKKHSGIYSRMKDVFDLSSDDVTALDELFENAKSVTTDETCLTNIQRSEISWRYVKASVGAGEFRGLKKYSETKKLYEDIRALGTTMISEGRAFDEVGGWQFLLKTPDTWNSSGPHAYIVDAVCAAALLAAMICAVICAKRRQKKALVSTLLLALTDIVFIIAANLYIPWQNMTLFGVLVGVDIIAALLAGCFAPSGEVKRKKTALTGILYGTVFAVLYWAPIVIINVIISGGNRNGESMLVSAILCSLFICIACAVNAKKKN